MSGQVNKIDHSTSTVRIKWCFVNVIYLHYKRNMLPILHASFLTFLAR